MNQNKNPLMLEIEYFDTWKNHQTGDWGWFGNGRTHCPYCKVKLEEKDGPWKDQNNIGQYNTRLKEMTAKDYELLDETFRLLKEYYEPIIGTISDESLNDLKYGLQKFDELFEISVKVCKRCSWWQVYRLHLNDFCPGEHSQCWLTQAILKSSPIGSNEIPTEELIAYLTKNEDKLYHIHYKKMEQIVGEVLAKNYDCDVIHCGQSHDRGIDLLLIKGEKTIPIQVKRRTRGRPAESVSVVRELLGVILRDQFKDGIVVTSSQSFSPDAKRDVHEVISKGLVDSFDLIEFKRFMDILKSNYGSNPESYISAIPPILLGKY